MTNMHDWTLVSVFVDWLNNTVNMTFKNVIKEEQIIVNGFTELRIPKRGEWGASVSVNDVTGPTLLKNGNYFLSLEIQSGDQIEIEAKDIVMPE